jgi:hydroxymethylglutaryl-CoA reductase
LEGEIALPIAAGLVGGAINSMPSAKAAIAICGAKTSRELACIMASVGLAQNFAALRALSTEGIQRGHMGLHAKNLAIAAGAKGEEIEKIAQAMADERNISSARAAELLGKMRKK